MQITELDPDTFVGPQIALSDMPELKRIGVGSIIIMRPDDESANQPPFAEIVGAAEMVGLEVRQIPVIPGHITENDIRTFSKLVEEVPKPIFAYCRSGARATNLWALNEAAKGRSVDHILAAAKHAGHDLTALTPRLLSLTS